MNVETSNEQPLILSLLLEKKLIDPKGLEKANREQIRHSYSIEEALVRAEVVNEEIIADLYAKHLGMPRFQGFEESKEIEEEILSALPEKFARESRVLPVARQNGTLSAAVLDPTDISLAQEIGLYTGLQIDLQVGTLSGIEAGLDTLFGAQDASKEFETEHEEIEIDSAKQADEEMLDLDRAIPETRETKVIRVVNRIFMQALKEKASDIHLEPFPKEIKLRYRIDGMLHEMPPPHLNQFVPIVSRIKILCKMDIAEKRVPQDGALTLKLGENAVDVRVSTVPTVYGEKIVMRLLNKDAVPLELPKLGFDKRQCEDFMIAANSPHGLMFVTGPTGSGKSTTLYATINLIMSPRKNILTVEDPVEYKFVGINQVQVKPQVDLTFARALRAFLRQDPDVIMVGEVRDAETAQICLRAALTGHFVLSTLHTNSALATVSRLEDMEIEPFLIASTLRMVEAQRLIRRLCEKCKEPYQPDQQSVDKFKLESGTTLFRPKGCDQCRDSGYKGRVGIFEVIRITPLLRDLIQDRAPLPKMEEAARKEGMQTLFDNALVKVLAGGTSLEEIVDLTGE